MSGSKVYSKGDVAFSWENKPGVSKVILHTAENPTRQKLPPPPFPAENAAGPSFNDQLQKIPLPPCSFQPPIRRSSSRRGGFKKTEDDPFLIAFKECTKSISNNNDNNSNKGKSSNGWFGSKKKNSSLFSCKNTCSVRDDSLVCISRLSISKSGREERNRELTSLVKFEE